MVVFGKADTAQSRRPPLQHVAALAVARRQAFEPYMFASIPGQILHFQPDFRRLYRETPAAEAIDNIDPIYDHLLVIYPQTAEISPRLPLTPLAKGEMFELFRIGADAQ
jgi:hypothetical protein